MQEHNDNSVIYYYLLPNIMDLLTWLQKITIFTPLDLRSGHHYITLVPKAKLKTVFVVNGTGM